MSRIGWASLDNIQRWEDIHQSRILDSKTIFIGMVVNLYPPLEPTHVLALPHDVMVVTFMLAAGEVELQVATMLQCHIAHATPLVGCRSPETRVILLLREISSQDKDEGRDERRLAMDIHDSALLKLPEFTADLFPEVVVVRA